MHKRHEATNLKMRIRLGWSKFMLSIRLVRRQPSTATTLPRPTRLLREDTAASIPNKTYINAFQKSILFFLADHTPYSNEHGANAQSHGREGQQGGEGRTGKKEREKRSALETKLLNEEVRETGVRPRADKSP